jgi:hypothetical protein
MFGPSSVKISFAQNERYSVILTDRPELFLFA